jgi:hypothetical protein
MHLLDILVCHIAAVAFLVPTYENYAARNANPASSSIL